MSHSYGNGSSSTNTYLNKKRLEDDNQMEARYHYYKYDKYDKYTNHPRYNNMNYMHSKQAPGNNYYNSNSRYKNNYYNNSKNYRSNSYGNKMSNKRDYKKPYQKFNTANANEGIRNLSHCEMPSSPPVEQKKTEEISEKNISPSTNADSNTNSNSLSNDGINIKDLNKFVNNITSHIPQQKNQNYQQQIFQNNQQNINIEIHLSSPANLKYNKDKQTNIQKNDKKDDEFSPIKIPKPSQKINIEPFNRKSIKIEENPLDNFDAYPKNPYDINLNINKKNPPTPINESIHNDNLENALSVKSSYLLAKIPNWRLVTNFVPASALTEEKFQNVIDLEKESDAIADQKKSNGIQILIKNEKKRKSHVVYMEKYEDTVEKSIELNKNSKKKINTDIFNIKSIIEQYHYDILKIKNKIKQNEFKTNYLSNKMDSLVKAIDDNTKE